MKLKPWNSPSASIGIMARHARVRLTTVLRAAPATGAPAADSSDATFVIQASEGCGLQDVHSATQPLERLRVGGLQRGSDMNRVLIQRCFSCRGCQRTVRTVGAGRWVLRGCVASAVPSDGPHELAISSIVSKRGGGSGSRKSTKPPFCEDSNGDANSRVPKSGANLLISRRYPQRRPNRPTRS